MCVCVCVCVFVYYVCVCSKHTEYDFSYPRDPAATEGVTSVNVLVTPSFHVDCNNEDKVNFEVQVALKSTAPWYVDLLYVYTLWYVG